MGAVPVLIVVGPGPGLVQRGAMRGALQGHISEPGRAATSKTSAGIDLCASICTSAPVYHNLNVTTTVLVLSLMLRILKSSLSVESSAWDGHVVQYTLHLCLVQKCLSTPEDEASTSAP